jgi:hypothetical protein
MRRKKGPASEGAGAIWGYGLLCFRIEQKILRGSRKIQKSRQNQFTRDNLNLR